MNRLLAGACLLVALTAPTARAAPFEDTLAQRLIACTACHGEQGRATQQGYQPRLAGKAAGYLFNQLLNFREGRRDYGPMTALVDPLDEAYLREIAAHFAAIDVPYPAPQASTATAATLARGEQLVRRGDPAARVPACQACHGENLMGVAPAIPGLLGLPRDYLNAQLGAWRHGKRQAQAPDCMAAVAKGLAPGDIDAVTQWLAARSVPPGAKPAPRLDAATDLPTPCGGVNVAPATAAGGAR